MKRPLSPKHMKDSVPASGGRHCSFSPVPELRGIKSPLVSGMNYVELLQGIDPGINRRSM